MIEQTEQIAQAQTQAELVQVQRELANVRAYARDLFFQNEDLRKRLEGLAFVEHFPGWRLMKYLRLPPSYPAD